MKTRTLVFFRCALVAALVCFNFFAYAGEETFNSRKSSTAITTNATLLVKDAQYDYMYSNATTWSNFFDNTTVNNRLILAVDQYSMVQQNAAYTVSVEFIVTYDQWNAATHQFDTKTLAQNPILDINYSPSAKYKDKAVYQFLGGNFLTAKIKTIKINGVVVTTNNLPVYIETEIQIDRHYLLNTVTPAPLNISSGLVDGKVQVYWGYLPGAEEYQLEWTYVNNFSNTGTALLNAADVKLEPNVFTHNSTRISTGDNYYKVPIVYEQGYLLFRVRGVGKSQSDAYKKSTYSAWSINADTYTSVASFPSTAVFQITQGHQSSINWQYNMSYAEEGKNKAVVSYYDGSLRNRQAVTLMNTQNQSVVGETIYDYQGRPAVQVLPVPQEDAIIGYKPNLNLNLAGQPYSKNDFDLDNGNCLVAAKPMDSVNVLSNGASKYYSKNNLELAPGASFNPFAAYVPSAKGYPFTQTQYTPDNTGRLKAQTGVGDQHQLGTKHETRYFYGKPTSQEELDRMFGSEVGNVVHYKKNMVIDPNGQISVSYLDPQGRVVATALAGNPPVDAQNQPVVDALPDVTPVQMQADLLNKTYPTDNDGIQQSIIGNTKVYSQEMLVSTSGIRDFHYKIVSDKFTDLCTEAGIVKNICYNCVLDLSILLTDECNQNYLVKLDGVTAGTTTKTVGKYIIDQINTNNYVAADCNGVPLSFETGTTYQSSFLEVGKYTLSKVLSVNEQALDFYTEDYIKNNKCLLTITDFITEATENVDVTGCNVTCEQCLSDLGSYDKYNINLNPACDPCLTQDEYNEEKATCDKLCDESAVTCENALQMLLNDVAILGQYGRVFDDNNNTSINVGQHPLSVFNDGNVLPNHAEYRNNPALNLKGSFAPNWRHPIYKDAGGVVRTGYRNEDGTPALVKVVPIDELNSSYTPEIRNGVTPVTIDEDQFVSPEDLKNVSDFIVYWQDQWNQSLVMHHPEYKQYEFCIMENASHEFDEHWLTINTAVNLPAGYQNPIGPDALHATDPYFNSKFNPNFTAKEYAYMLDAMNNYTTGPDGVTMSIWQMAYATNNCPYANTKTNGSCQIPLCYKNVTSATVFDDKVWSTFRGLYYSLKQKVYNQAEIKYAIRNASYGGCIGESNFNPWQDNFFNTPYYGPNNNWNGNYWWYWSRSQFYNWEQTCSYRYYWYYAGHTKRFLSGKEYPQNTAINSSVCYDEATDGEYDKVDCQEQNLAILEDLTDETDFQFYEMCGECPIVKKLETLFDAVAKSTTVDLTTPAFQLSCFPQSEFPQFTQEIETALNLGSGSGEVFWNTVSSTAHTLNVNVSKAGGSSCALSLAMKNSYSILDLSTSQYVNKSFTWSDIQSICCLSYLGNPTLLTLQPGKNFLISATVKVTDADGAIRVEKISIEGVTSCIVLNQCEVPRLCKATPHVAIIQRLFNNLLYSSPAIVTPEANLPAIDEQFTSSDDVLISADTPPYDAIFIDSLKTVTGMTTATKFYWSASAANGTLSGTLQGVVGNTVSGQCLIEFYMPTNVSLPSGVSFANIVQLNSMAPDKTSTDPSHYFTCYALIAYQQGDVLKKQYIQLKGYSPCVEVGTCVLAKKPGQSN